MLMILILMTIMKMLIALNSQRFERLNFTFSKWGLRAEDPGLRTEESKDHL